MYSTKTNKGTFVMVHILRMTTAVAILAFAATGVAQARPFNYQHGHFRGYAGPVYSSTSSVGPAQFVPGRGIIGESCDMPSSACSNDQRIND
jgi:hypothetical protein